MRQWTILALLLPVATGFVPGAPLLSRPSVARVCRQETVRCAAIARELDEDYVASIPVDSPPIDATREAPKVNGAIIAGTRKLVVITGASSGLGKEAARSLCNSGKYFVIMACRDVDKAKQVAEEEGFPANSYTVMKLELGSLESVRSFVFNLKAFKANRPLDRLVCNAAVYLPADPTPRYTDDGFEMSVGVNHLGHFLLCNLLIDDMKKAKDARMIVVGSITGNSNTIGGGFVYPKANLGSLSGLAKGKDFEMIDGGNFNGAKAYKDAKMCNMMTVNELHKRYHDSTGITFSSLYPGCIATTNLFREKRLWFRKLFPVFMKYVTGGFVGERESGERLAQVVDDPICTKSGVYWSWNGNAQQVGIKDIKSGMVVGAGGSGGEIFENEYSGLVNDEKSSRRMWDLSCQAVGLNP